MKKKVLFALIALFSFLTTWAQQAVPAGGDYAAILDNTTVTFNNNRPFVLTGAGLPVVTGITLQGDAVTATISPALNTPTGYKVFKKGVVAVTPQNPYGLGLVNKHNGSGDDALEVGNYWLQFQYETSQKLNTIYVPFQVYMEGTYDYIDSEASFNGSVNKEDGYFGGLKLYYADETFMGAGIYDDFTTGNNTGEPSWMKAAAWGAPKHNSGTGFPWVVPVAPATGEYKCLFIYKGTSIEPWRTNLRPIFSAEPVAGAGVNGQVSRTYGIASVRDDIDKVNAGVLVLEQGATGPNNIIYVNAPQPVYGDPNHPDQITAYDYTGTVRDNGLGFDRTKFAMYWMPSDDMGDMVDPVSADRIDISSYYVKIPSYTYNANPQQPTFDNVNSWVAPASDSEADARLKVGEDFTVEFTSTTTDIYTNAGDDKPYTITGKGLYKGTKQGTYPIAQKVLTANDFSLENVGPFTYDGTDKAPKINGSVTLAPATPGADTPDPTVLNPGTSTADFDVDLYDGTTHGLTEAVNAGTYTYTISPKGNYKKEEGVTITKIFTVTARNLAGQTGDNAYPAHVVVLPKATTVKDDPATTDVNEEVKEPGYIYNTKEQKLKFTGDNTATPAVAADAFVKATADAETALVEGQDFDVTWTTTGGDYTNVGEKAFTITGKNNYAGTLQGTYNIFAKNIADDDVVKNFKDPTFSSEALQLTQANFDYKYNEVALNLAASVDAAGDFTWALTSGDATEAGDKEITVTGKGNYTGEYVQTVKMKQYQVTITPANLTKIYGEKDPAPNFTVDAGSAAKIPYGGEQWLYIQSFLEVARAAVDPTNAEETKENVGDHQYIIRPKAATLEECNYEIVIQNSPGTLSIYPAPLNVHVANNSKTYGDPDPNFIADKKNGNVVVDAFKIYRRNADGSNGEDVTNSKDFVDATKDLKDVLNIGRKPGEDVKTSPYDFTWNNPNYVIGDYEGEGDDRHYVSYFTPTAFTINQKNVSIYEVTFDPNGYPYTGAEQNPIPTVTANNGSITLTSGVDFIVEHTSGTNGNNLRDVTLGVNKSNGNYWPKATIKEPTEFVGNYHFGEVQNNYWKITPVTLTITAIDDNSKIYNTADPNPLTKVTLSGIKGSDYWRYNATTGALETNIALFKASDHTMATQIVERVAGEHVGTYKITKNSDLWTRNYNIVSTAEGEFHIYLSGEYFTVTFNNDATYQYDTQTPFDVKDFVVITPPTGYTGSYTDLENEVKANAKKYQKIDPETGEINNETGVKTYVDDFNVGTYKLTIHDCPTAFKGYHVQVVETSLQITPYPLYIASFDSKEYGSEDPDYDWSVYEWVKVSNNPEKWDYVETTRTDFEIPEEDRIGGVLTGGWMDPNYNHYTISRVGGEEVGHYATTIREWRSNDWPQYGVTYYGTQYNGNYSFQFVQGDFEITRRALTITVTGNSKFYGELDPEKVLHGEYDNQDVPAAEEPAEGTPSVDEFTKGLVKITVTNALNYNQARTFANMVDYSNRVGGEVVTANGYAVNGITFNSNPMTDPNSYKYMLDNYELTFNKNAQFMINKRLLKVIVHDQSVPYAVPVEVDPYDLTIVESILKNGAANEAPVDVNYDKLVTSMSADIATDHKAINDRVDQVFKPLTVKADKTKVGVFHRDAYDLDLTDAAKQNYELEYVNGKVYIEQLGDLYLDTKNLAQVLNDHIGRTVTVHMIGAPVKEEGCNPFRQWMRNVWNSFVLPFDAYPRDIVKPFQYGVIDILNEDNDVENNFSLAVTTKKVVANTPFIIQNDKNMRTADMANVKWEDVTISDNLDYLTADPTATDAAGNKFIGTYKPKKSDDFTAADYIIPENTNEFFRFLAGAGEEDPAYDMKQTEAYLQAATAGAPARIFIDEEDGSVTAIEFVGAEAVTTTSYAEGWYTINGIKLEGEPTVSGTYIYNGKKVFFQAK